MKNQELHNLIFSVIREQHAGQINLASEASAINLADNISSAICEMFHVAKRRETQVSPKESEQLNLFQILYKAAFFPNISFVMKYLQAYMLSMFLMFSCADERREPVNEGDQALTVVSDACEEPRQIWICHNLESELHGSLCTEECYTSGNLDHFCWSLNYSDCLDPLVYEWQIDNCRKFQDICTK